MNATQQAAIAHYIGKGLSKDVAVGIVAVLMCESSLNPAIENNSGTEHGGSINPHGSYGLAQWNGTRQDDLAAFATKYAKDYKDINTQLDFVLTEAANSYPDFWKALTSPATTYQGLISAMVDSYEIPADKEGEINKALAYAQDFYANYVPVPTPTPKPTPTPTPTPAIDQSIIQFIEQLITNPAVIADLTALIKLLILLK